jgi:hypothetical protein
VTESLAAHRYFNVMLRYPVLHRSSRSMVIDAVRPAAAMPEMYPCFSRGMDIRRTLVAMELLKKNMEQLLASQKIQYPPAYPPNLLLQLHVLFHSRRAEMQAMSSFFARAQGRLVRRLQLSRVPAVPDHLCLTMSVHWRPCSAQHKALVNADVSRKPPRSGSEPELAKTAVEENAAEDATVADPAECTAQPIASQHEANSFGPAVTATADDNALEPRRPVPGSRDREQQGQQGQGAGNGEGGGYREDTAMKSCRPPETGSS